MAAMRAPYPLWSANLDRSEITAFYQQPQFRRAAIGAAGGAQGAEETIRTSHGGQIEADQLHAMLAIQQQRDRRMAERLLAAPMPVVVDRRWLSRRQIGGRAAASRGSATGGGADGADAGGTGRTGRCEHRRLPVDHTISEMNTLRE